MDQGLLDHIFDPFFTTRRDQDGTGLGLFISYGLVKEHHGLIGVLSRPGMGSRFTVFLPVDGQGKIDVRPTILCLDPDEAFLKELKLNFVDAEEWPVRGVPDPEQLVSYIEDHPEVDFLIAEIEMPEIDGLALLQKVRERFPLLPIVLYSGEAAVLNRARSSSVKADYVLKKPFHIDQLQKIIQAVGRQRL